MIPGGGGEFRLHRRLMVTSGTDSPICLLDIGSSFRWVRERDHEADHSTTSAYDMWSPTSTSLRSFTGFSLYDAA